MPLDNANYIKDLNPLNPNGAVDAVSLMDDSIREVKRAITQTLPNFDTQVEMSSADLNTLKAKLVRAGNNWDVKNSTVKGVIALEDNTAIEPRSYNDARYLKQTSNLADLKDNNAALTHLLTGINRGGSAMTLLKPIILDMMWPIGSVYYTESSTNPSSTLGGTWQAYAQGRVIVGSGSLNDGRITKTFVVGSQGGEFTHKLTTAELPSHTHPIPNMQPIGMLRGGDSSGYNGWTRNNPAYIKQTNASGGNQSHNIMQPYIVLNIWKRIR